MDDASAIAAWANFFAAEASASAALAGLVFVALSINLPRILAVAHLPGRAAETLAMLVGSLVVCSVGLVPGQPIFALGCEYLAVGLAVWGLVTANGVRRARYQFQVARWRAIFSSMLAQGAALPFIVAGIVLMAGHVGGVYWVVPGVVFSFFASVLNAWVLLVEILR